MLADRNGDQWRWTITWEDTGPEGGRKGRDGTEERWQIDDKFLVRTPRLSSGLSLCDCGGCQWVAAVAFSQAVLRLVASQLRWPPPRKGWRWGEGQAHGQWHGGCFFLFICCITESGAPWSLYLFKKVLLYAWERCATRLRLHATAHYSVSHLRCITKAITRTCGHHNCDELCP